MRPTPERDGPLHGTVVVDLSRALAGPHAAMMLGDMGARVIKVESPAGDESRAWGPPFVGPPESPVSTYFLCANRNKESVQLDLKSRAGRESLESLVQRADVLIENFRPGVMDRLGLSVGRLHELNPRLVVLSITGFGHDGPEADRPGFDQIAQGEAGLMSLTGTHPGAATKVGVPIADLLAGLHGAFGVVTALLDQHRTGRGTVVRTSLLAGLVGVHAYQGTRYTVAGEVPQAAGNHHPSIAPYGAFRCADELVQVAVGNDTQWAALARAVGLDPDDERYATNARRVAHRDGLVADLERALSTATAATWLSRLHAAGVPAGRIRTLDEVYSWEQVLSQGLLVDVEHPVLGQVSLPGSPLRLEDTDGRPAGRSGHTAPPLLGEHTAAVLDWLHRGTAG
ncbi:MAG: CaiB/BaiF CoA transferase family protein [Angustibacter sp.]